MINQVSALTNVVEKSKVDTFRLKDSIVETSFQNLSNLPYSIYLYDNNYNFINSNDINAFLCSADSSESVIGKNLFDITDERTAQSISQKNANVINKDKVIVMEENFYQLSEKTQFTCLTIKLPIYNQHKQSGILGLTLAREENITLIEIANFLNTLIENKLITTKVSNIFETLELPGEIIQNVYLSKREMEIIKLTKHVYTAKQIGKILNISHRTVEHHFANIKRKLGVSTKTDLMDKLL